MRSSFIVFLIFLGLAQPLVAQKNTAWKEVDKKVLLMPSQEKTNLESLSNFITREFKTPQEKIRAVYFWLADNISYDVAALRLSLPNSKGPSGIEMTLTKRKGVCHDYAEAFQELCKRVGIPAYYVAGYTKQYGQVDYMGHAWCAAQVDGKWYLFDPTWGAGYLENNKFVKSFKEEYFMVEPTQMLKSHYPFDPLWQLSVATITAKGFNSENDAVARSKSLFHYKDTIAIYSAANEHQRLQGMVRRITAHGIDNAYQKQYLDHLKEGVDYGNFTVINAAYNKGIESLNKFIHYRNSRQLTRKKEEEFKLLISSSVVSLQQANHQLINTLWLTKYPPLPLLEKNLKGALTEALEQEAFLTKHFNPLGLAKKR